MLRAGKVLQWTFVLDITTCIRIIQKLSDVMTGFWPSPDGRLPADEPICGFRNERCDYTMMIVLGIVVILLLMALMAGFCLFRFM